MFPPLACVGSHPHCEQLLPVPGFYPALDKEPCSSLEATISRRTQKEPVKIRSQRFPFAEACSSKVRMHPPDGLLAVVVSQIQRTASASPPVRRPTRLSRPPLQRPTSPPAWNVIFRTGISNGLQPTSDGLQPTSNGLQPSSDGLQPNSGITQESESLSHETWFTPASQALHVSSGQRNSRLICMGTNSECCQRCHGATIRSSAW